ncbi:uridine diphosphate-N-acetylglucosamine-binding protein YvcK [Rothia sp. ZJ932]|uniref:gluconeogenesis factor YvcK family protein n=1 Tax=Rothia sp. ZJ932 TaxID=2810516 RepID=UPI001967FB7A|nr:uridine diphosphate-N-acetylglucosamine-binding protein YvcK [Rothia sp. ZJ932]QRZ60807.1 uridine diphosphate-N-acetylglucosamine-binding protein YvcK [Rothia sp. ZJ932]
MSVSSRIPQAREALGSAESGGFISTKVVALGGGHGLFASLAALKHVTNDLTAVVTVADDGGSSGVLRNELDVLPPGDLRMALSALCDDSEWGRTWSQVMQHRFHHQSTPENFSLENHALGNLLIVALWELLGDPVAGLDWAGALLNARGRVLPMSRQPLVISGVVAPNHNPQGHVTEISGQAQLAKSRYVRDVRLHPEGAEACEEALAAIDEAEWIILGPGSWMTSVLPHLLLPEIRKAISNSDARKCLVMNLELDSDETGEMSAEDHLAVLNRYAPEIRFDAIIADPAAVHDQVAFDEAAARWGATVQWSSVHQVNAAGVHDSLKLGAAYRDLFAG